MEGIYFNHDLKSFVPLLAFAALLYLGFIWKTKFAEPSLLYSDVTEVSGKGRKTSFGRVPDLLKLISLASFILAFVNPHFLVDRKWEKTGELTSQGDYLPSEYIPKKGIALYFVLDRSGSMVEKVPSPFNTSSESKIDIVKKTTKRFIEGDPSMSLPGRPNDLIGLIFFARGASVESPLSLDHQAILQSLDTFQHIGKQDQDGTAIGYAIYKTVNMIAATRHYEQELADKGEPAYTIKNSVIILVTDGMQDPNPLDKGKRLRNIDIPEAAQYAKENQVRLYMINVEPSLNTSAYSANRNIMQRAAELTGGKFYSVNSNGSLEEIYHEIDQIEKTDIPSYYNAMINKSQRPDLFRPIYLSPYFILLGLLSLLLALLLESTLLRRFP